MRRRAPTGKAGGDGVLEIYRHLLPYVRRYWLRLGLGLLFGGLYAAANGGLIWALRGGIDKAFGGGEQGSGLYLALLVLLFLPVVGIVRGVSDFLSRYYVRWAGNRVVMDLRNDMFTHLHDLSVGYFSNSRTGELISRIGNDTVQVEQAVSNVVIDLAKQPLTLVAMLVWIFTLDPWLATVSLFAFPLCIIPMSVFGLRVRRHSKLAQERIADVIAILQETLAGVRIVKAFGMEDYETGRFVQQTRTYFERIMRVCVYDSMIEPIIVLISMLGFAMVLHYVRRVGMSFADVAAFVTALFMMYEPVKKLGRIHVRLQQSAASADRVIEVLQTPADVTDREGARDLEGEPARIEFDRVGFGYGTELLLRDITIEVRAGERIAFVGSSGAGKTSLVNLLPRFYDVNEGEIRINGTDIRDLTLRSLRGRIGLVTQETFLFNDTVANNIGYGCRDADRDRVVEAARRAFAHDFILEMPDGYDTVIGERGVRLSGGQRQRLAIARAILRNPPILILDEATSALDTESERMVQAALDELMSGRTVLAIAHRLSTISTCNRILVMEQGRIVERGSPDVLLAQVGIYMRLYDLQFA